MRYVKLHISTSKNKIDTVRSHEPLPPTLTLTLQPYWPKKKDSLNFMAYPLCNVIVGLFV